MAHFHQDWRSTKNRQKDTIKIVRLLRAGEITAVHEPAEGGTKPSTISAIPRTAFRGSCAASPALKRSSHGKVKARQSMTGVMERIGHWPIAAMRWRRSVRMRRG